MTKTRRHLAPPIRSAAVLAAIVLVLLVLYLALRIAATWWFTGPSDWTRRFPAPSEQPALPRR